jgi:integrase/recombinase XerD
VRGCPSLAKKNCQPARDPAHDGHAPSAPGVDINTIRAWLGHVSIDTTNLYAEVDRETKAHMLAACGSFTAGSAPTHR